MTVSPYLSRPCRPLTQALADIEDKKAREQMRNAIAYAEAHPEEGLLPYVPGWRTALEEAR